MWATAIELGIPALLIFALWRVWPKEGANETEQAGQDAVAKPDAPGNSDNSNHPLNKNTSVVDHPENHDHSPR